MYERLPPGPQRKEPNVDIFPELPEGDSKRGLSNYLDEFLSAIKVFGYLERHVFHELTRTMQTKKLIAGETILLEEEQGFCLVVDGLVQIFVKSTRHSRSASDPDSLDGSDGEEDGSSGRPHQGYQLLTEVKNGAPMSSLFSILSLFTEDVKLRHEEEDDEQTPAGSRPTTADGSPYGPDLATPATEVPHSNLASPRPYLRRAGSSLTSIAEHLPSVPPFSLDSQVADHSQIASRSQDTKKQSSRKKRESAHPDIVARATRDTTIAIIPATAFRRLTRLYPKASAHIVQVILTRLQRVTLSTGHAYLGLTSEVLRTEKLMNKFTTYDLPGFLRGSALDRLKEKFQNERQDAAPEDSMKGIALHNPRRVRKPSAGNLRREAVSHATAAAQNGLGVNKRRPETAIRIPSTESERLNVNAGDLLTNAQFGRLSHRRGRPSVSTPVDTNSPVLGPTKDRTSSLLTSSPRADRFALKRQESIDEDSHFRDSITDCMLRAIGLSNSHSSITNGAASVEQSPRIMSYDTRSHRATFSNAFGFLDAFEPSMDGDTESVVSAAASTIGAGGSIRDELSRDMEIVFFPKGAVLVEQGERNPGLYYVIDGFLDISVPLGETNSTSDPLGNFPRSGDMASDTQDFEMFAGRRSTTNNTRRESDSGSRKSQHRTLYLTKPGGLAGYLGTISSRRSFVDITAKTDVYVGFLPRTAIERIVEKYPIVLLTMAKRLTTLLPRLILHIDFALEWVQVDAGQAIWRQGDESDAIYIVLNGRLRMRREGEKGKMQVIGEYGQGDSIGELEVLTESKRPGTLHAIRDTELARVPKTLFNSIALDNPEITIKMSKIIATRMRDLTENSTFEPGVERTAKAQNASGTSTINLRTVAVLPVTAGVPVVEFASRLHSALAQIGTPNGVVSLNQGAILSHLGRHAFNRMGKLKLSQYLADLEEKYGLVLYIADTNVNSPWTSTCISQADCILLVGLADGSPNVGEYERLLLTTKTTARKELVLLHPERYCPPGLTRRWLRNRTWINGSHHHIQMPYRESLANPPMHPPQLRRFGTAIKQRVQVLQAEIQKYTSRRIRETPLYSADTPFKGDFHRLSRRLIGKSVGLVLGGGGARGISHIGIIRALEEAGIPIDIVGGTSIGSFVGGLYAWDADVVPMYGRAKKFAGRMSSMWRFALDLTYPSASYTTGHEFNRGIFKTFGTAQIEDFWLEFYCNTTNITKSRVDIHTSGYVWRYVRASMTLAGLVPPMVDEHGSLLVDGGYVDNLTVAHMKSLGANVIFAVDVGAIDDESPQSYGDSLSGFWAAWNRWNPFSTQINPPTLSEIQARLAYVSSVDALERAKNTPGCRYMRPPVVTYGTLEFAKFDEIYKVGYEYGKSYLADLRAKGVLPNMGGGVDAGGGSSEDVEGERGVRRTMAPRRASI